MNNKEIQELVKLISKSNLTEFKLKKGDLSLSIRTKKYHKKQGAPASIVHVPASQPTISQPAPAPAASPAPAPAPAASDSKPQQAETPPPAQEDASGGGNLVEIKSPIVGTFYRSSSPDKPPFLKVGDRVEVGDVVCIVEAMKLFNEIESEVSGEVVKVFAEDASPVEYDQPLFLIDPSK